jgi:predicted Zn finger-like uncharacterized protein
MPQLVSCPHCQRQLNVPDALLGKNVKCPSCQNTFTATAAGAGSESAAESSTGAAREEAAGGGGTGGMRPHRGMLILILGIVGVLPCFVCAHWVCAALAVYFGHTDLKAMDRGEIDPAGRGLTKIGWILGIVGLVFLALEICSGCISGGISLFPSGK